MQQQIEVSYHTYKLVIFWKLLFKYCAGAAREVIGVPKKRSLDQALHVERGGGPSNHAGEE
jgi:hypothetical protein